MRLYLDSAYVAKCYINEYDSAAVRALVRGERDLESSGLSVAELACICHRHVREKGLTRTQARQLRDAFLEDVEGGVWLLHPVSDGVLRQVESAVRNLAPSVHLRTGAAIHLVSARNAGFSEIWSSDRHLLGAARHLGLRGCSVTS